MEVALPGPGTFSRSPRSRRSPLPLRPLVEEQRSSTPNHPLHSKFYGRVKSNSLIQAEPAEVHFSGFEVGETRTSTLQLINISSEVMHMHILPTQTKYFQTTYTKKYRLVPGLAYTLRVQFCPDEWRYFYDCIRIHCKGEENLIIPVHAYPVIRDLHIPPHIHLPATELQQSVSHVIPLRCSCPIDFEFQIFVIETSAAFSIQPLSGVIPANGGVDIVVTFTPLQYQTSQITFKLVVSQFNSKPILCTVSASSNPHVAISQVEKRHKDVSKVPAAATEDTPSKPRAKKVSKVSEVSKVSKVSEVSKVSKVSTPQMDVFTHGGVAKMMIRESRKLKSKDLKDDPLQRRRAREAAFLKTVAENQRRRQERSRQWQVDHVGEDHMCADRRREVLQEREEVQSGKAKEELYFGKPLLSNERVVLELGQIPEVSPQFQSHTSINWDLKHRCLQLFQQAAYKIVIQCRMNRRLVCLRKLIKEMKKPPTAEEDVKQAQYSKISPDFFFLFPHPTFWEQDDPLALDLSLLPAVSTDLTVSTTVPFFKLKVPRHYKLMDYKPVSLFEAYTSYIPTSLPRPLRPLPGQEEGPRDDAAKDSGSLLFEHEENTDGAEAKLEDFSFSFSAPDFKPIPAHPLRIFNPAPGLHAHLPVPKYLEWDPEYDLCPLPTYHRHNPNEESSVALVHPKEKEVMEDMMSWKRDFGVSVSACLAKHRSHTHLQLPARSIYGKEILPSAAPHVQEPQELRPWKDKPPSESTVHLTPEMVNAEMVKVFNNETPIIPSSSELKNRLKKQLKKDDNKK